MARTIKIADAAKSLKAQASKSLKVLSSFDDVLLVPSGCTVLDLACSGTTRGAFPVGTMANIIGDSSSGKTLLIFTMLAELAHNPLFDEYQLIYDEPELADRFDKEALFGKKMADRVMAPNYDGDDPIHSKTVEDLAANVCRICRKGKCIYICDSFDALDSDEEMQQLEQDIVRLEKGKSKEKEKGSYGTQKAKSASKKFKQMIRAIDETKSLLIIISQTREALNAGPFSPKTTRSGGKALKFFATHEMWLTIAGTIKDDRYKKIKIGKDIICKITKNKVTGHQRDASFSILDSYGVDDVGACVDFLIDMEHWRKQGGYVVAKEFDMKLYRKDLLTWIEDNNKEKKVKLIVGMVWNKIEEAVLPKRKPRY